MAPTADQIEELIRSTRAALAASNRLAKTVTADAVTSANDRAALAARVDTAERAAAEFQARLVALEARSVVLEARRGLSHRALDVLAPFVASSEGRRAIALAIVLIVLALTLRYSPLLISTLPFFGVPSYAAPATGS